MSKARYREATKEAFSILSHYGNPLIRRTLRGLFSAGLALFDKHNGIPGKVQHFAFLAHVSRQKDDGAVDAPFSHGHHVVEGFVLS